VIGCDTKSVEYRLVMRRGKRQKAKGGINNQFLITRFSMSFQFTAKKLGSSGFCVETGSILIVSSAK
jgi:hypothetical protein